MHSLLLAPIKPTLAGKRPLIDCYIATHTQSLDFRMKYKDVHMDQYHFVRLQMPRQGKNEGPQEFSDRCRALAQKIVKWTTR